MEEAARQDPEEVAPPEYLGVYDRQYFEGGAAVSSYASYASCRDILYLWAAMLDRVFRPQRVLDVAAAYGFVVDWFTRMGVAAVGVEPSEWALSQRVTPNIIRGWLPDQIPHMPSSDLVVCTECLEHIPTRDVPHSLDRLANLTRRPDGHLVLLIMLAGHPTAHDDAGHLTLESREWWEAQLEGTGMVPDLQAEERLNNHPTSEHMMWTGRIFVRKWP